MNFFANWDNSDSSAARSAARSIGLGAAESGEASDGEASLSTSEDQSESLSSPVVSSPVTTVRPSLRATLHRRISATQSSATHAVAHQLASTRAAVTRLATKPLHIQVPDRPVQAVADYSVGYGKQVFWSIIAAAKKWQEDDASAMAAGVAYYLALSLFPMLLLLTAGLGLVFRFTNYGHDAELQILSVVSEHCSPSLEQQVRQVLSQLREHSLVGGPFGLVTAVLAAIGVFYQFERAFDRIWNYKPRQDVNWMHAAARILKQRFSAFCLLGCVGLSIILILLANVAVGFIHGWMLRLQIPGSGFISGVDACMTLLLNAVVFGLLYRWLPKRRLKWADALRGGLIAALVWEAGRQLLGAVLIGVKYTTAYGAIGSFIAMLLWCYWGVSIIFFGAEYAQVLSENRRLRLEQSNKQSNAQAEDSATDRADHATAAVDTNANRAA